ncbi:MAG: VCBS repeat-containing protein, partial [Phycisphaerae bacterium]|nr:VCBS repeat-containing protein [Phycisphaerae bacterium]
MNSYIRWLGIALLLASTTFADGPLTDEQRTELAKHFGFDELQIYKFEYGIMDVHAADMDLDGRTDVILWNPRKARFEILYQPDPDNPRASDEPVLERNELGSSGPLIIEHVPIAYRVGVFEIADMTADGRPDIVFFGDPKELVVVPGLAEGGFGPADGIRAADGVPSPDHLAIGDFNHDGRDDAVLLGTDDLLVFHQKAGGGLDEPLRITHSIGQPIAVRAADIDGNGLDDIMIVVDEDQYGLCVMLQEESGKLGALRRIKIPKLRGLSLAPNAGSGDDAYMVEAATGRLICYEWQTAEETVDADWPVYVHAYPVPSKSKRRPAAVGDIDGDGLADLVSADPEAARLILFKQGPRTLEPGVDFPGLRETVDVQVVDLNGDGHKCVLSVSAAEKMIGISEFTDGRLTFPRPLALIGDPLAATIGKVSPSADKAQLVCIVRAKDKGLREQLVGEDSESKAELFLCVRELDGNNENASVTPIEKLDDDPTALRLADVNQDGLTDVLAFVPFSPLAVFLQTAEGGFERFEGADKRDGLVKDADLSGFALVDVADDAKPEIILAQKNLARALVIRDGKWTVVDQYNATKADAKLTGVAAYGDEPGNPTLAMYDKQAGELLIFKRRSDNTYDVTKTCPVGDFDLSALIAAPVGGAGRLALVLANVRALATLRPGETAPTYVSRHAYETDTKDGWLGDAVPGDVNHDGVRD